jgi:hypothetical protein
VPRQSSIQEWTAIEDVPPLPTGFFAYSAAPPSIPEIINAAIDSINKSQLAKITTWQSLQVGGKYVIGSICLAIDESDFFCADVTTINANVLFELGFAIARNKRIWLIRDDSYTDSKKEFDQLKMLTTIGYTPYLNVEQIIKGFFADSPHNTLEDTIFRQSIEASLGPIDGQETLLYLKSRIDTEASVRITRILQDSKLPLTVDDPRETSVQPLVWYAQKLYSAISIVAHFLSPAREGFRLHNARYALVSGLARGFGVKSLMLTEQSELLAPIDYRDALRYYTTPMEAARETDLWLQPVILTRGLQLPVARAGYADALKLATELKDFHLQLGEYVAENESNRLADYFVETTAYMDVINGTHAIFVGRKGTGKTSNLIKAALEICKDVQNLVVIVKPVGYEIEGLARLFAAYKTQDYKGYVIESLWKYMLYTEIAHAAVTQIQEEALWQLSEPSAQGLLGMLEKPDSPFAGDFTVRLERVVKTLETIAPDGASQVFRSGISEALHSGALSSLRSSLAEVLSRKRQVILLVDNLDKPWTKSSDLDQLSEFLVGLLSAASRVGEELRYKGKTKGSTKFNSAIFLRSDIFNRITSIVREPDKMSYTRLSWDDPELLLRVIEERYTASHGSNSDPATMWHRYFCSQIKGIPTREYLTSRILPRPRDIVFFVKAAVSFAVNRKHDRVEEKDILDGERQYSQYALDSILVENGITIPQLEAVLLEFLGSNAVVTESDVRKLVSNSGIDPEKVDPVIAHLVKLTFLGLEIELGRFVYSDETRELKKNYILAERYASAHGGERHYEIKTAFRAYLEVRDSCV